MKSATERPSTSKPDGGMSIREVAAALGLTRQQVVEAEKRAKRKLEQAGLRDWL